MLRPTHRRSSTQDSDGLAAVYDVSRSKHLSAARPVFTFGFNHRRAKPNFYLRSTGDLPSSASGYLLPRNATVTAITVKLADVGTGSLDVQVERGGTFLLVSSVTLTGEDEKVLTGLDVDVQAGDALAVRVGTGPVNFPVVSVELAWRLTL